MALVSMDVKEDEGRSDDMPGYDCCPCIYLNDDQVEALGITSMPEPGSVMMLTARVVVSRVTAEAEEADEVKTEGSKPDISLTLTITDMEVTKQNSSQDIADALYK